MRKQFHHAFSRTEIHSLDTRRFLRCFGELPSAKPDKLVRLCDSLVVSAEGYEGHPEELYVIEEVRLFYQELTRQWPYWLYALNVEHDSMMIPLLCLLPSIAAAKRSGSARVAAGFDPRQMGELLLDLFPWMNLLCERAGLSEEFIQARSKRLIARAYGLGGGA